jgi:hypothetical protein
LKILAQASHSFAVNLFFSAYQKISGHLKFMNALPLAFPKLQLFLSPQIAIPEIA